MVYSDGSELELSDETIRIKNIISVESYDGKTAENFRKGYVVKQRIVSKLLKISILNFDGTN